MFRDITECFQLLVKQKSVNVADWESVARLSVLARTTVLRIMESADENVGTLNPLDVSHFYHFCRISLLFASGSFEKRCFVIQLSSQK